MIIGKADKMLEFGTVDFGQAAGTYYGENILNLAATDAGGMAVHVSITEGGAGGTSAVFAVEAGNGTTFAVISQVSKVLADLGEGACVSIPIPREYEGTHLRLAVTTTGTFSAGTGVGTIDPYVGK